MSAHPDESRRTIPWEAFDVTHPDHDDWVERGGQCRAGDRCTKHAAFRYDAPSVDVWYDADDCDTSPVKAIETVPAPEDGWDW